MKKINVSKSEKVTNSGGKSDAGVKRTLSSVHWLVWILLATCIALAVWSLYVMKLADDDASWTSDRTSYHQANGRRDTAADEYSFVRDRAHELDEKRQTQKDKHDAGDTKHAEAGDKKNSGTDDSQTQDNSDVDTDQLDMMHGLSDLAVGGPGVKNMNFVSEEYGWYMGDASDYYHEYCPDAHLFYLPGDAGIDIPAEAYCVTSDKLEGAVFNDALYTLKFSSADVESVEHDVADMADGFVDIHILKGFDTISVSFLDESGGGVFHKDATAVDAKYNGFDYLIRTTDVDGFKTDYITLISHGDASSLGLEEGTWYVLGAKDKVNRLKVTHKRIDELSNDVTVLREETPGT